MNKCRLKKSLSKHKHLSFVSDTLTSRNGQLPLFFILFLRVLSATIRAASVVRENDTNIPGTNRRRNYKIRLHRNYRRLKKALRSTRSRQSSADDVCDSPRHVRLFFPSPPSGHAIVIIAILFTIHSRRVRVLTTRGDGKRTSKIGWFFLPFFHISARKSYKTAFFVVSSANVSLPILRKNSPTRVRSDDVA